MLGGAGPSIDVSSSAQTSIRAMIVPLRFAEQQVGRDDTNYRLRIVEHEELFRPYSGEPDINTAERRLLEASVNAYSRLTEALMADPKRLDPISYFALPILHDNGCWI